MTNNTDADIRAEFEEEIKRIHGPILFTFGKYDDGEYMGEAMTLAFISYKAGIEKGKRFENEACAKVCDEIKWIRNGDFGNAVDGINRCSKAIRARINHDR